MPSERDLVLLWCCGATYKSKNMDAEDDFGMLILLLFCIINKYVVLGYHILCVGTCPVATNHLVFLIVCRDVNKTVNSQAVESAKAEERLLNMDFVTAKAKELSNRRERAEVCRGVIPVSVIAAQCKLRQKMPRYLRVFLFHFALFDFKYSYVSGRFALGEEIKRNCTNDNLVCST